MGKSGFGNVNFKSTTKKLTMITEQKDKTFWTEKVGFEVVRETPMGPNAFWLEVATQGAESALVIYPRSMMKNYAELKPSVVFVTENMETTYENMKSKGIEFEGELQVIQWGTFALELMNSAQNFFDLFQ